MVQFPKSVGSRLALRFTRHCLSTASMASNLGAPEEADASLASCSAVSSKWSMRSGSEFSSLHRLDIHSL